MHDGVLLCRRKRSLKLLKSANVIDIERRRRKRVTRSALLQEFHKAVSLE